MSNRVPAEEIEQLVGHVRVQRVHYGRAVSDEKMFYVLHSKNCLEENPDLRRCVFSVALDAGIDEDLWSRYMDQPMMLSIVAGQLYPGIIVG